MLALAFDARLFRLRQNTPQFAPLFQLPPTIAGRLEGAVSILIVFKLH